MFYHTVDNDGQQYGEKVAGYGTESLFTGYIFLPCNLSRLCSVLIGGIPESVCKGCLVITPDYPEMCSEHSTRVRKDNQPCSEHSGVVLKGYLGPEGVLRS